MFQPRKYKKKELLEIFRTRNDNAMLALIDSLWREYPAQWKEQKLSISDINKADLTHLDYNPLYVYAASSFREADGTQAASYATANGFGHKVRADFAQVHGYHNEAYSFFETIIGPFGTIAAGQTPDAWIPTDRLFTLANGFDAENRSDALNVYKSGYAEFHNAIVPGAYNHSADGLTQETPLPGSFQYTEAAGFEGYHNDEWIAFAAAADMHNPVTIADDGSQLVLSLLDQELSIDLSNYAEYDDIVDTFIELYDTPGVYKDEYGLISAANEITYSKVFGSSATSFWIEKACPNPGYTDERIENGSFDNGQTGWSFGTGWYVDSARAYHSGAESVLSQTVWGENISGSYRVTFNSEVTVNSFNVSVHDSTTGANLGESYNVNFQTDGAGTCLFTLPARSSYELRFTANSNCACYIDNVTFARLTIGTQHPQIIGYNLGRGTQGPFGVSWRGPDLFIGTGAGNECFGIGGNLSVSPYGATNITTGAGNTIIGSNAGNSIVTSHNSTIIGYMADNPDDESNYLNLAGVLYGVPSDINLSGNLTLNKDGVAEIRFPETEPVLGGIMRVTGSNQLDYINPYLEHLLTLGDAGQLPVIVDTEGVKSISWADAPSGLPDGTNGDILYYNNGWVTLSATISRRVLTSLNGVPSWQNPVWTVDTNGAHNNNHIGIGADSSSSNRLMVIETGAANTAIYANSTSGRGATFVSGAVQAAWFQATNDSSSTVSAVAINNERNSTDLLITNSNSSTDSEYFIYATAGTNYFNVSHVGDIYFSGKLIKKQSGVSDDEYLIAHLLDSGIQSATAGHVPTIVDTEGVKSIEWAAAQAQIPGTETLSGTSVTVSWNGKTAASLTLTGATTITFGTPANYVKRLFVSGDYSLTLPASAEVLSGEYDGTKVNIIDLIPSPSGTVYVAIN